MNRIALSLAAICTAGSALPAQDPALEPLPLPSEVHVVPEQKPAPVVGAVPFVEQPIQPRIRNITRLHNSMTQPLEGIGIVVGLQNTGSSDRATRQALVNMIRRKGLNISIADVTSGSVALVQATATLPAFAKVGQEIDVKVEVVGDATSLRGGELVLCELYAVDGTVYATAQGSVLVAGYSAEGQNARVTRNHVTTGWVHNGGQVVKDLESSFFSEAGHLELQLLNPGAFNAAAVADGINRALEGSGLQAVVVDTTLVRVPMPEDRQTNEDAVRVLNLIGDVRVRVENPAKVVVDQASGAVIAGEGVLISPCVVGLSDLTISVINEDEISQPYPGWNRGTSERVSRTRIEVARSDSGLAPVAGGATIGDLLQNLRALGLSPPQLINVFQQLETGGFLQAELEVR